MFSPSRGCFAINDSVLDSNRETMRQYALCIPCCCVINIVSIMTFGLCGVALKPVDTFCETCTSRK